MGLSDTDFFPPTYAPGVYYDFRPSDHGKIHKPYPLIILLILIKSEALLHQPPANTFLTQLNVHYK